MINRINKNQVRAKKHDRIRNTLSGTADRPRLNVYRSTSHIYAQIIDDESGKTLASSSTLDKTLAEKLAGLNKKQQAELVGKDIAKKAKKAGVKHVVFDRGGYIYTGRIQALSEGARSSGLEF